MKSALRLRRPADFTRARRFGAVYRKPDLLINVWKNGLSHNRYGIVASKQLGVAVIRNKAKRRLRAILWLAHSTLQQGYDIVVVARASLTRQPFCALQRIVSELLVRAQLLGND